MSQIESLNYKELKSLSYKITDLINNKEEDEENLYDALKDFRIMKSVEIESKIKIKFYYTGYNSTYNGKLTTGGYFGFNIIDENGEQLNDINHLTNAENYKECNQLIKEVNEELISKLPALEELAKKHGYDNAAAML